MRFFAIFVLTAVCAVSPCLVARQIEPSGFHIAILDGEGALNNVKGRLAREPIVQVEDKNHRPVVGAYVTFDTPANGPGAVFADGSTHFTTATDAYGRAVAHGLRPNNATGKFDIHVHVTYQGQSIGDVTIHQVNVSGPVASLSKGLQITAAEAAAAGIAAGVLGVVVGPQFLVNGSTIAGNANLLDGARIQTLGSTVKVYVHGQGEFLIAPHSSVIIGSDQITLQNGVLRALHFGTYKVGYGSLEVTGLQGTSDGIVGITAGGLQVASLEGPVQVLNTGGSVAGTVAPGEVSTFGNTSTASSGATAENPMTSKRLAIYDATLGATLAALGLAVDGIVQGSPTPTSP